MKKFHFIFLTLLLINSFAFCQDYQTITAEEQEKQEIKDTTDKDAYYQVNYDLQNTKKFIKIDVSSTLDNSYCSLYVTSNEKNPGPTIYTLSSIEKGENLLYVPITISQGESAGSFLLNVHCDNSTKFKMIYQRVEMMEATRLKRLDFLTFDYEDYLIKFDKDTNLNESQLMVTAAGGARGHHGTKNNVKMSLYYRCLDEGKDYVIDVNSDTMFNGAGITFREISHAMSGEGYYLAKVRGPENTYISFMVRRYGMPIDIDVNSKAIYGYIQDDDIDLINLVGHGITPEKNEGKEYQISILVKGDLLFSKSTMPFCDVEEETESLLITDELSKVFTFTEEDIKNGYTYICLQGKDENIHKNAYVIDINEVSNQLQSTVVKEPLVNGYSYYDLLKQDEVRTYRHSKHLGEGFTKFNIKAKTGKLEVVYIYCQTFPNCLFDKEIVQNGNKVYKPIKFVEIDKFFTMNVDKTLEISVNSPKQYLLTVLCLSSTCDYEASFNDDEDSLVLEEDNRISQYVQKGSQNYYHFNILRPDDANKVIVKLRTFSGDATMSFLGDTYPQKTYFIENTEIYEFFITKYVGFYNLEISSKEGSYYMVSYNIIKGDEDEETKSFYLGYGITLVENIQQGYSQKLFTMRHDMTRGDNLNFLTNFYPINCKIQVEFFNKTVPYVNGMFQHEISKDDEFYDELYFNYKVTFESFLDQAHYPDKMCIFYISSQEIAPESEALIGEGTNLGFILTNKINSTGFVFPYSSEKSDAFIKFNLENNYPIKLEVTIDTVKQQTVYFSRSTSYYIKKEKLENICSKEKQVCGIIFRFSYMKEIHDYDIVMNIVVNTKESVPSYLIKNSLKNYLIQEDVIHYYILDLGPKEKGEITLNFKQGSGIMFGKIVGKEEDPEEGANWKNRVRLPLPNDVQSRVGEYQYYKQTLSFDTTKLKKHGIPICENGCELYLGVMASDNKTSTYTKDDFQEYSIYHRIIYTINDEDIDIRQEKISKLAVNIPANEFVLGAIEDERDYHYYSFEVTDECDSIKIEFQSESCSFHINYGDKYPDIEIEPAQYNITSKISKTILIITKEELHVDTLKGKKFKIAINPDKFDLYLKMLFNFRIRIPKKTMPSIIEVNANLDTICGVFEENSYCDILYPVSYYQRESNSSLLLYADSEIINDITIYMTPIDGYEFDSLTKEEVDKLLPRKGNSKKSTENQNIKNYIEINPSDLKDVGSNIYILFSIKAVKPGVISVYTTMREHLYYSEVTAYGSLIYNRLKDDIIFNVYPENSYTYQLLCIDGEGKMYFEEGETQVVEISGNGNLFSITLPELNKNKLIITPDQNKGLKFLISETIYPVIRDMTNFKYGYSGKISYGGGGKHFDFPLVYYMKVTDEEESINVNLHFSDKSTDFDPMTNDNYTEAMDLVGYVIDEPLLINMMRKKNVNPPISTAIRGRYDKSLGIAKLYITSKQIKEKETDDRKYILITYTPNAYNPYTMRSFTLDTSLIPFTNDLYISPFNIYIAGNLLKGKDFPKCNKHRLRAGNTEDKYLKIEYSKLSNLVSINFKELNGKKINYIKPLEEKYGKTSGIIQLEDGNEFELEICNNDKEETKKESSLNYIFKVRSSKENDLDKFLLPNTKITFKAGTENNNKFADISFKKVLNKDGTKAIPCRYFIRIFDQYTFNKLENVNTITFLNYYSLAVYVYDIYGTSEDESPTEIYYRVNNLPSNTGYYISILAVTFNDEEIFSYDVVAQNIPNDSDDSDSGEIKKWIFIIVGLIVLVAIVGTVFLILFKNMKGKEREMRDEIKKLGSEGLTEEAKESLV